MKRKLKAIFDDNGKWIGYVDPADGQLFSCCGEASDMICRNGRSHGITLLSKKHSARVIARDKLGIKMTKHEMKLLESISK